VAAGDDQNPENLTQTERFSRQLFSTVTSLSENGVMDQTMVDQMSDSLAEQIKNIPAKKIFLPSDIKIINDDSARAIKNYEDAMLNIQKKYPDKGNVFDILQRFVIDEKNATVDSNVLLELDPIIAQTQNTINAILKISIPRSLSALHLNFLNAGEILMENISDMRLFDTDPILSLGAMSKYEENIASFQSALTSLMNAVNKKLGN